MAIKEENAELYWSDENTTTNIGSHYNGRYGLEFIPLKDFYIKGGRIRHWNNYENWHLSALRLWEINNPTLTNLVYNTESFNLIGVKYLDSLEITSDGMFWTPYYYFDKPLRVYSNRRYLLEYEVWCTSRDQIFFSSDGITLTKYNNDLIKECYCRLVNGSGNMSRRTGAFGSKCIWVPVDFIADTFDYSYLVRDRKETKKIFVPTIDTDLTLSQDNLGDWNLNKLQSNNTTSVSFPIFKDVKYNLTIPEGAKFCYAGTLDKKVSDFDDSETRVLNRILVDDATVTNPLELEFTALQNERGFVAYINDADVGLTPDQVTLTGTAGYELYKLTNEEGTEYEALPDFDITSEQFKNGSPLFVEPQANVLMDFAHPSVLYWQELETDNPMLQVKITATPHSQHVTGDKISLEVDGVLCDIAEMQVDSEGGAILAFSFDDKQTWVYWKPENENDVNVGEWVTITEADRFNGQSKDVTDALSPANWKLAIGDADGFYIRASFISTTQALAKIGVKYSAREDATTTEVETEGTD